MATVKSKKTKDKNASRVVKRLWASVNHSPYQVITFLEDISEQCFGGKLLSQVIAPQNVAEGDIDIDAHIFVVISASTLESLASKVDLSNKTIILIENVVIATQYKDIILLDCTQPKSYHFRFKPLDSSLIIGLRNSQTDPINLETTKVDIIPELLNAQPPSILNPVMTLAYKIPDVDKRTKILVDIFDMISSGGRLEEREWYSPNNKQMVILKEWLDSDIGKLATSALSKALNKVKVNDDDEQFRKLAEEYDVSKFDIAYSVEFIKKIRVNHPHIDTKHMFMTSEHKQD